VDLNVEPPPRTCAPMQAYSHGSSACPPGPCWAGADLLHGAPRREAHVAPAIPAVVAELVDALA
jgi:hypothetical protein